MVQVTITQLSNVVAEIQGKQIPKILIKTDVHGDKTLSAFDEKGWIGKKIHAGWSGKIIVEQRGDFLNFRLPTKTDMLDERIARVEAFVGINKGVSGVTAAPQTGYAQAATPTPTPRTVPGIPGMEYPQGDDINPNDIPL